MISSEKFLFKSNWRNWKAFCRKIPLEVQLEKLEGVLRKIPLEVQLEKLEGVLQKNWIHPLDFLLQLSPFEGDSFQTISKRKRRFFKGNGFHPRNPFLHRNFQVHYGEQRLQNTNEQQTDNWKSTMNQLFVSLRRKQLLLNKVEAIVSIQRLIASTKQKAEANNR